MLKRLLSETIIITAPDGTRVVLTIVEIRGSQMRIGIDAPREYTIHRGEIQDIVDKEKTKE